MILTFYRWLFLALSPVNTPIHTKEWIRASVFVPKTNRSDLWIPQCGIRERIFWSVSLSHVYLLQIPYHFFEGNIMIFSFFRFLESIAYILAFRAVFAFSFLLTIFTDHLPLSFNPFNLLYSSPHSSNHHDTSSPFISLPSSFFMITGRLCFDRCCLKWL